MFKHMSKFRDPKKRDGVCRFFKLSKGTYGYVVACLALIVAYLVSASVGQMTFAASYGKSRRTPSIAKQNRTTKPTPKNMGISWQNRRQSSRLINDKKLLVQKNTGIASQNRRKQSRLINDKKLLAQNNTGIASQNRLQSRKLCNDKALLPLANKIAKTSQPWLNINGQKAKPIKLSMAEKRQIVKLRREYSDALKNYGGSTNLPKDKRYAGFLSNVETMTKGRNRVNAHFNERHGAHRDIEYLKGRKISKASKFIDNESLVGAFLVARQIGKQNPTTKEWSINIRVGRNVGSMLVKGKNNTYPVRNIKIVGRGQDILTIYPTDEKD